MSINSQNSFENTTIQERLAGLPKRVPARPKAKADGQESGATLQGFGPMTRVSTSFGDVHAQALRVRDLVRTRSGEFLPIVALDRLIFNESFLKYHPRAMPIVIRAGAMGPNMPKQDVMFAPSQKISGQQRFLGDAPALASDALSRPNVLRQNENIITYTVFHCGRPASVLCEGMWVDTAP